MRRRDESGAVAVIVAVMAVILVGITAFTADLGLAYANKRQIQTAADAAVLAAASELAERAGNCVTVVSSGASDARTEATSKVAANDMDTQPAVLGTDFTVQCVSGVPTVSTSVTSTSARLFGKLFGAGDYALTRSAAAQVEVPSTGIGLRPIAICSKDLTPVVILPSPVIKLSGPGGGHIATECPDAGRSGNWWTIDCPGSARPRSASFRATGSRRPLHLTQAI